MAYNKKAHLRDNIEAIRLMFRLEKEQRTATPEEAGTLAAYSGFGGIKAVLSPFGKLTDILRWTQADRELFPLVTELHNVLHDGAADEREYKRLVESVKASTFTAFYTPPAIVNAIASSLGEHGVSPGRFLDPSSGTGNLFQPSNRNSTPQPATPPKLSPMKRICLPAASSPGSIPKHRSISRASRNCPRIATAISTW